MVKPTPLPGQNGERPTSGFGSFARHPDIIKRMPIVRIGWFELIFRTTHWPIKSFHVYGTPTFAEVYVPQLALATKLTYYECAGTGLGLSLNCSASRLK